MAAQGQFISMPGGGGTEGDDKSHGQASKSRASLADASTEDVESQQELKGSLQAGASGLRRRKGDSVEEEPEAEPELEMQRHGTWKSCVGHIITAVMCVVQTRAGGRVHCLCQRSETNRACGGNHAAADAATLLATLHKLRFKALFAVARECCTCRTFSVSVLKASTPSCN